MRKEKGMVLESQMQRPMVREDRKNSEPRHEATGVCQERMDEPRLGHVSACDNKMVLHVGAEHVVHGHWNRTCLIPSV